VKIQTSTIKRILKFLISGSMTAIVMFSSLFIFQEVLHLWYLASSSIAFLITVLFSFMTQKKWAFADHETVFLHRQFVMFVSLAVINFFINLFGMYVLVDIFSVWYVLSQIIITGLIASWDFLIYHFILFPKKSFCK